MPINSDRKTPISSKLLLVLIFISVIILLPIIIPVGLILFLNRKLKLNRAAETTKTAWGPQNKHILLVYSNSPHWKDYIEKNIIPKIKPYAEILNFSEKSNWHLLEDQTGVRLFLAFSGVQKIKSKGKIGWFGKEYNPVVIVLLPDAKPKIFHFWKAFRDYKHGKDKKLRILEDELFKCLKTIEESKNV